jgi:hypothetical protein
MLLLVIARSGSDEAIQFLLKEAGLLREALAMTILFFYF